jgi:hypothetical protein
MAERAADPPVAKVREHEAFRSSLAVNRPADYLGTWSAWGVVQIPDCVQLGTVKCLLACKQPVGQRGLGRTAKEKALVPAAWSPTRSHQPAVLKGAWKNQQVML